MATPATVMWFRNDLRITDNTALHAAAQTGGPVVPLFVLDDEEPQTWRPGGASRWWLDGSLAALASRLEGLGSRLVIRKGRAREILPQFAREVGAAAVHCSRGYEPWCGSLESDLKAELSAAGIEFRRYRGVLLFEPESLRTREGEAYRVYSPFARAAVLAPDPGVPLPAPERLPAPAAWPPSLERRALDLEPRRPDWAAGLRATWIPGAPAAQERLAAFLDRGLAGYRDLRDRPDLEATSRLSPHLHMGEISVRACWHGARFAGAQDPGAAGGLETFLRELLWREFSYHLLVHWPDLPSQPFRASFGRFPWAPDPALLRAWQKGLTGYPIVDAGMRELWGTGWMHNRVRMITASFLIKHLLQPWQDGAAWFWDTLVDADLASNSASWQWVAGSGADAAPYFRIFNPVKQGVTFDPDGAYVRRWCPELAGMPNAHIHAPWMADESVHAKAGLALGRSYPAPIVDHLEARGRAMAAFLSIKSRDG